MLVGAVVALIHYATSPAPVAWPDGGFYLPPPPAALQQIYDNLCTVVNIEALVGTQSQTDDDATVDVAPLPQPEPFGQPNPIDPHTREDDDGKIKVLTVGDGDFGYSIALAQNNPDWQIIGTSYGNGSNNATFVGFVPDNLALYTNVDATRLDEGWLTRGEQFDTIVFNNPRSSKGWFAPDANELIDETLSSAVKVLKPGGQMRFSGTGGMPTIWHLRDLWRGLSPPAGYSNSYTMGYYADPLFGVYYQPLKNNNEKLDIDLFESNWYVFVK